MFEIGWSPKLLPRFCFADMVVKGEVKLDDPIALYLPKEVKVPQRNGRANHLCSDLATHRAGFPRNIDGYPKQHPVPTLRWPHRRGDV